MSPLPRPAFALALATAIAGTTSAVAPMPAGADDPEMVERCFTEALTTEEVEDGAVSVVECYEVPAAARMTTPLAILYDISNVVGDDIWVTGGTCTGASVSFGAGHVWDNRVSATDLVLCGNAKHYTGAGLTGNSQLKQGVGYHTFNTAWNNVTSSIEYAP